MRAINWGSDPLMVVAGPGSGKTTVLTLKIALVLSSTPAKHFKILGLTFTKLAADQMRNRVLDLSPGSNARILISTFHSFANDLLQQYGSHVGLKSDFEISNDRRDRTGILERAIAKCSSLSVSSIPEPQSLFRTLDSIYELYEDQESLDGAVAASVIPSFWSELYKYYLEVSIEESTLDFSLVLHLATRLLKSHETVRRLVRNVYRHVYIDEYQDSNPSQAALLNALLKENAEHFVVVADEDQVIYQWRGASPGQLRALRAKYNMAVLELPRSHRCPPEVIDAANRLISHNRNRLTKSALTSEIDSGHGVIIVQSFLSEQSEVTAICGEVSKLTELERRHCAILARNRRILESFARQLESDSVPFSMPTPRDQFISAPVRLVYSVLRLSQKRMDLDRLGDACQAIYEITGSSVALEEIAAIAEANGVDYLEAVISRINDLVADRFALQIPLIAGGIFTTIADVSRLTTSIFSWLQRDNDRIRKCMAFDFFSDFDFESKTWNALLTSARVDHGAEAPVSIFIRDVELMPKSSGTNPNVLQLLTVHSAKGLEYDHVFLVGVAEEVFPAYQAVRAGSDSPAMEEERRSFFVAITRTQRQLTISYSERYFGYQKKASRFISEMFQTGDGKSLPTPLR
jgi:DNA helicase-2/ATP-dependent DNA helicase PcrA